MKEPGNYEICVPLGGGSGDAAQWNAEKVQVKVNDAIIGDLSIPNNNWTEFQAADAVKRIRFEAKETGTYKVTLTAVNGAVNIADFLIEKVSEETPTEVVTTEKPTEIITTEAPTEAITTEAPIEIITTEAPTEAITTEAPTEVITTERPTEVITTEKPTEVVTTEKPGEAITTE